MSTRWILLGTALALLAACGSKEAPGPARLENAAPIDVTYPLDESVFPPDLVQPTIVWKDATAGVETWRIHVDLPGDVQDLVLDVPGDPPPIGEIDESVIAPTNKLPEPPGPDVRSWRPDDDTWATLTAATRERWATVWITGLTAAEPGEPRSQGRFRFMTSKDPVGAPIFYRDVPLAPATTKKGTIKPLADSAINLIRWRLRDLSQHESRVVLEGMPTCANCHSFSNDGSTFGMDIDGPEGDKGTYAVVPLEKQLSIDYDDIITWNDFPGRTEGLNTFGFLSRVSPDGRHVVSTVNEALFVVNYTDYGFLQAFYPTRGILAWLDTETRAIQALPGADDPAYVHCTPVWTPDGKDVVFARATARDPYDKGKPLPEYPNDPNEPEIRYDLVRMPFDGGRGGTPVPIEGASENGMSNTFPKISPDGKWIVFTKCRNGLLMRPDGRLWIVPTEGGEAREMRCNTWRMNSWHSWSPNGRWLVFSSKGYSPYTQLLLTHVDEDGNDTPAILIPNSTPANRASNIPEFLNAPYEAIESIDVPGVRHRRDMQRGYELLKEGKLPEALTFFKRAVAVNPDHAGARVSLGWALSLGGDFEGAVKQYQEALSLDEEAVKAHLNLGHALLRLGRVKDAIRHSRIYLTHDPENAQAQRNLAFALIRDARLDEARTLLEALLEANANDIELHRNLGLIHLRAGRPADAIGHLSRVVHWEPGDVGVTNALAWQLATCPVARVRDGPRAVVLAERLVSATNRQNAGHLGTLAAAYAEVGSFEEAIQVAEEALALPGDAQSKQALEVQLAAYREGKPFRYAMAR